MDPPPPVHYGVLRRPSPKLEQNRSRNAVARSHASFPAGDARFIWNYILGRLSPGRAARRSALRRCRGSRSPRDSPRSNSGTSRTPPRACPASSAPPCGSSADRARPAAHTDQWCPSCPSVPIDILPYRTKESLPHRHAKDAGFSQSGILECADFEDEMFRRTVYDKLLAWKE